MWTFIKSSSGKKNWLFGHKKEICFIGRSNVGKSSIINSITCRNNLAKTSNTPGRTQLINFFEEKKKIIVDLPGYGYAKMPKNKKLEMIKMIEEYFLERKELIKTFVLVDSKVGPTKDDKEIIEFLNSINKNFMIVLTKSDKAKQSELNRTLVKTKKLHNDIIITSSYKKNNILKLKKIVDFYFK